VPRLVESVQGRHGVATTTCHAARAGAGHVRRAAIFTIHGFCQRALADTPFTAQMPLALELVRDDADWWPRPQRLLAPHHRRRRSRRCLAAHLVASKDTPGASPACSSATCPSPSHARRGPKGSNARSASTPRV